MSLELVPLADEHIVTAAGDEDEIVGHEAMPALDEIEHAF
jgi:hypothetical protein